MGRDASKLAMRCCSLASLAWQEALKVIQGMGVGQEGEEGTVGTLSAYNSPAA